MSAESDLAVGFGEPDTITDTHGIRAARDVTIDCPPAPPAGIAAHNRPDAPGWSSAATAIHSMRKMANPMLLFLEAAGECPIVLDFEHNVYACDEPIGLLPSVPDFVTVSTRPVLPDDPTIADVPGRNLDALLWMIGLNSFAGALAWWMPAEDRFHMVRWPNLTELVHSPGQMRMIAMLGNAYLSPTELASAAGSSGEDAQRLLNALSLMGLLQSSSNRPEPVPNVALVAHRHGLFHRLFERLAARG